MKKTILCFLAAILIMALAGCSQPAQASELKSSKPRNTSPATIQSDMNSLVEGNTAFALNLYQLLKNNGENLFYSPYSISEALAMTYGGARGETEAQMAAALQFKLAQNQLHAAFNSLDLELAQRGEGARGQDGNDFRLNVVNAIWGQKDFHFSPEYLDLLAENYGAGLRIVDFIKATEESRKTINEWVSQQTEEKIQDLLPEGSISHMTRLVLTNAVYFNAAWARPFSELNTTDGQFTLLDGSQVTVPMMEQRAKSYSYAEGTDYQAIELPYDGNQMSMIILLPQSDQFKTFEAALNNQQLNRIISELKSEHVNLTLPKFEIEGEFSLQKTLSELGMPVSFSETEADFSGMTGKKELYIQDVVHKSFINVNEEGTEAAAATGVIMDTVSMPMDVKDMVIDSPFIFLIRDIQTETIIFMGRVANPGA